MKKIVIIIPSYNGNKKTIDCLESINSQDYENFNLIIVDNNSSDTTLTMVNSYLETHKELNSKTQIVRNKQNLGFAKAINIGIKKFKKKNIYAFLFLNQDTIINKQTLQGGLEVLMNDEKVGVCSPKILYPDNRIWWVGTRLYTAKELMFGLKYGISEHLKKGQKDNSSKEKTEIVDAISGCAMYVKAKALWEVGLMDESYYMYAEDMDFSLRMKSHGYKLVMYTRGAITHDIEDRKKDINRIIKSVRKYRIYLTSVGLFILKNYSPLVFFFWLIKLPFVLGYQYAEQKK